MMTTNGRPAPPFRKPLALFGVLLAVALLAACAAAGAPYPSVGPGGPAAEPSAASGDGKGGNGDQFGSLADRKIIKTGEIGIEVPNVATALAKVRALAISLGGYVGGSESGTKDQSATLTLRIPADRFEDALTRLHELDGTVVSEATHEQDVTSSVVDLEARLKNLQASEFQYRTLLAKAEKIEEILAVQTRLDDVRGQIEQLQAQHKELTGLASLSTLTVTLVPGALQQAASAWDPGKTVSDAVAALVGFGQGIGNFAIWFVIVLLPVLVGLLILVWLGTRLFPGLRNRFGQAPKA